MYIPHWLVYFILLTVVINNLGWVVYHGQKHQTQGDRAQQDSFSTTEVEAESARSPFSVRNDVENRAHQAQDSGSIALTSSADELTDSVTPVTPTESIKDDRSNVPENNFTFQDTTSPMQVGMVEEAVTVAESEAVLSDHDIDREFFFSFGTEEKLDSIQRLSSTGKDLTLIRDILQLEDSAVLRATAVSRLGQGKNFIATGLLLTALDDVAEEVRIAALTALASTGDRSVTGLLRERLHASPEGAVRDHIITTIGELDRSVTMSMDNFSSN